MSDRVVAIVGASGVISGTLTTAGTSNVTVTVSDGELEASTSFSWTVVEPNGTPEVMNPGSQSNEAGESVSLTIQASDPDSDALSYAATGLPAGLSIDGATGVISGTLTTAGTSSVTVTVSDGELEASTSFSWTVVEAGDNQAPTIPGSPEISVSGTDVILNWAPSQDNVGVAGYIVYRSDRGNGNPVEIDRTSGTQYTDTTAARGGQYFYSVAAFDEAGNVSEVSGSTKIRLR